MAKMIEVFCSNCGKDIKVPADSDKRYCPSCGHYYSITLWGD